MPQTVTLQGVGAKSDKRGWAPWRWLAGLFRNTPNANGAKAQVDFTGVVAGGTEQLWWLDNRDGRYPDLTSRTAYAASVYCYTAIQYRAGNLAEAPLRVLDEGADGDEFIDHPLDALLAEPSPDWDMNEIVALTQQWLDLDGAALWVLDQDGLGAPAAVTPFGGQEFKVYGTPERQFGAFDVETRAGSRRFPADEVVFFKHLSPLRTRFVSPTDVALSALNLSREMQRSVKDIVRNALMPSLVVMPDASWAPDEPTFKKWKAALDAYALPANKGKPLALLGGGRASAVSLKVGDLLPSEVLDRMEANVAAAFGIAPVVLGFLVGLRNSPWSQMAEARRTTYEDTLIPLWKWHARTLTRQLLRPRDRIPTRRMAFDLTGIQALADDEDQKARIQQRNREIWTVGERRTFLGREPFGDERDDLVTGLEELRLKELQAFAGAFGAPGPATAAAIPAAAFKLLPTNGNGRKAQHQRFRDFHVMADALMPLWEREIGAQLAADRAEIVGMARTILEESKELENRSVQLFLDALEALDLTVAWLSVVDPLLTTTGTAAVRAVASALDISFAVLEPGIQGWVASHGGLLITEVTETTKQTVRDALTAALEAGEGIPEIAERLSTSAGFAETRATLIARTETVRAANGAQFRTLAHYQEAEGVGIEKSWLSARDDRVRDEHMRLDDGAWHPLGHIYANGLEAPGEPNCRCTLLYRTAEGEV